MRAAVQRPPSAAPNTVPGSLNRYTILHKVFTGGIWIFLGVVLGFAAVQHSRLMLYALATALAVLFTVRVGCASCVLVMALYAGFATLNIASISLGSKTLFLSPGDISLLGVTGVLVLQAFLRAATGGGGFVRIPRTALPIVLPLGLLAFLFAVSTLLAATGPYGYLLNLPRSLLFYSRWLSSLIIFAISINVHVTAQGLYLVVFFLAVCLVTGFLAATVNGAATLSELVSATTLNQYTRVEGLLSDPNQLGQIAVLFLVLLVALALTAPRGRIRGAIWLTGAALALITLLTQSREALLTLLIALVTLWYMLTRRRRFVSAFLLFLLLIGGAVLTLQSPRLWETLARMQSVGIVAALNGRDQTWGTALGIIGSYPLTGIGFENMSALTEGTVWQAHNGFLQAAVVSGILGLLGYVWLLVAVGERLRSCLLSSQDRTVRAIVMGLMAVYVGYIVTAFVSDHFITFYIYNDLFWGLTGLTLAAAMNESRKGEVRANCSRTVPSV